MPRDDDEAPDPRRERPSSSLPVVLLIAGTVGGGLMLAAAAGVFFLIEYARGVQAPPVAIAEQPRAGVGEPVTIDGLAVKVVGVEVGKARLYTDDKKTDFVEDDQVSLLVRVELSAANKAKTYSYRTWRSPQPPPARDDLGVMYNVRRITSGGQPGWVGTATLRDGEAVTDTVAFQRPVDDAHFLDLNLPGENAGVTGTFRFRIPRAAWEEK